MFDIATVQFDHQGLVPVIVQHAQTGQVLTLAYANREALEKTQATRELHFWSRSRQELWHKGATSGNTQHVRSMRFDCDRDAILAFVDPAGPACHTGAVSCFQADVDDDLQINEVLSELVGVIENRQSVRDTASSYTAKLLADPQFAAEKVLEEANELVVAVAGESDRRIDEEAADLVYHLLTLIATRNRSVNDLLEVLRERRK